ncbi:hypothetical protein B0A55_05049 [Friedmanniomyces simplex]|uniref:Arginase n=1 Tax=Friedmanniomyces simplex TaxID=329884 RepID=A0A4U0XD76_9PEZI|nr:hypothetical protein B0A55_05049 [Friedmanniomyces simplex]
MAAHNQPTYDFLSGGVDASPPRQPLRETLRETMKQSTVSRADINNENLRAQVNTLQYELDSLKQERDLTTIQHQRELRDAQSRAEADFKRFQAAESASNVAKTKAEKLARDLQEVQDRAANERIQLEKKIRGLQDDNRQLREEVEDASAELSSQDRQSKYAFGELEQKYAALQASVEEVQQDLVGKVGALQSTQQRLVQKETQAGELENEVLRLKALAGDSDTLVVIKKELSEQVAYIKKLEMTGREQAGELKQYRKMQKSIEAVEEEKRALESRVRMMDDMRRELAEAQLQRRILEDERCGWTSYLESQAVEGEDMNYETPEQMAKAFLQERLAKLSLVDKLGSLQPELAVREQNIRSLEDDKAKLNAELDKMRAAGSANAGAGGESRARLRLERHYNLAKKEVEYLRAQQKATEAEETEFGGEQVDEEHKQRVQELEEIVERFRSEMQTLHADLSNLEAQAQTPVVQTPQKRPREDDEGESERLGELRRKARTLQDELEQMQNRNHSLEAELKASMSQLTSLKEASRTRVLELRNNPTAAVEAVKMATLTTLREENTALLAQLEGKPHGVKVVPISTLESVRLQLAETKAQIAQHEKKTLRLKQIWGSKALEFREAVCSILGWKLDFMPNGRVKATSILYPSTVGQDGEEEEENSIVFDGENGTMKVSGGPQSVFAGEIKGLIDFWVEGRKEVPCFLAACTRYIQADPNSDHTTKMDAPTIQPKFLKNRNDLGLVAVGFSGGQCKPGVDAAPMALIESGLVDQLKDDLEYNIHYDGQVHAYGELMPKEDPDHRNMKKPRAVSAVTQQLSKQVYEHAKEGRFVLTLGGDHSIAIGTISGTAKAMRERLGRDIAVIWVDAHADINTPETSDSGNIHGMPVAFLTGLATDKPDAPFGWLEEDQRISVKKLVYIGLRDIDRGEKKILREHGIKAFSMHDVDRHGIGKVMDMALGWIGSDTPIHLSFDIDALDPMWAPSTGTAVRGGLTLREGDFIAECVHETGSLIALDLVEVNPSLEEHGAAETVRAGCSIVRCALGDTLL